MPDIAATGVYSVEGQDALANDLAGIDPNAVDDDPMMDGGAVIDTGEAWDEQGHAIEPDVDPHQLAADRIRADLETQQSAEETVQWLERHEQEQAAAEQEAAFSEALEHYAELDAEGQREVNLESFGRAYEAMSAGVDASLAQQMTTEMFGSAPDPTAAATLLGVGVANVIDSLANAGITSMEQLTPEAVESINDPSVAAVWVNTFLPTIGLGEMVGQVNPTQFVGELLPFVPVLLSGQNPELVPEQFKVAYSQALCRAFGSPALAQRVDPKAAAERFAVDARWLGKIGTYLQASRQRQAKPERTQKPPRQAKPSSKGWQAMKSNRDIFDGEARQAWERQHGGI